MLEGSYRRRNGVAARCQNPSGPIKLIQHGLALRLYGLRELQIAHCVFVPTEHARLGRQTRCHALEGFRHCTSMVDAIGGTGVRGGMRGLQ